MENAIRNSSSIRAVANELPYFKTPDERELLLGVIGALVLRRISLSKASEIMGMEKNAFLTLLDSMKVDFSYLEESDALIERKWK
jgi:predicted HTH domain antitoxin